MPRTVYWRREVREEVVVVEEDDEEEEGMMGGLERGIYKKEWGGVRDGNLGWF